MLPFGIIEKHGPHLPLGTDLINVRYAVEHAAQQEYTVIFPAVLFWPDCRGAAAAGDGFLQHAHAARSAAGNDR